MLQDEEWEICSPSSPPEICSPSTPETRAIATYADFLELYLSTPVWTRGETLPGPKLTSPVGKREDEGKKHGRNLWEFLKSTPWIRNFDARTGMALVKCLTRVDLDADECLFHQGEEVLGIFILLEGSIALSTLKEVDASPPQETVLGDAMPSVHSLIRPVRNYKRYVDQVVEDFGMVVGESDDIRKAASFGGSDAVICNNYTAVAQTAAKLMHLSRSDYMRHVQQNALPQEKVEKLKMVPLFARARATLSKATFESLASAMLIQKFPANRIVATKGEEARLFVILRGTVEVVETEKDTDPDAPPDVAEVIVKAPNQRERVGCLGLKRKAAISLLSEMQHFGLVDALSQKGTLQDTYVTRAPTDIMFVRMEEARKWVYAGWLTQSKADLERIGPWHSEQLQKITDAKHSLDRIWGRANLAKPSKEPRKERRSDAFAKMTTELWGHPSGQSGLPTEPENLVRYTFAQEPTPKFKCAVMRSSYADPTADQMVSVSEAILLASMRVNPDMRLRLTTKSPVKKNCVRMRPWGAKIVPGTDTMVIPPPVRIPLLDLHKVRQSRRRNDPMSERNGSLARSLKQAIIHRYRTADGINKSEYKLPPTAASMQTQEGSMVKASDNVLPLLPSQTSTTSLKSQWRAFESRGQLPGLRANDAFERTHRSPSQSVNATEDEEDEIFDFQIIGDVTSNDVDNNESIDFMVERINCSRSRVMGGESSDVGRSYATKEHESKNKRVDNVAMGTTEGVGGGIYGAQGGKIAGFQLERPTKEQALTGSAPIRQTPMRLFSLNYDPQEFAPKRYLRISGLKEPDDSVPIENTITLLFRGLDVSFIALYEGSDCKVSEAFINFATAEGAQAALQRAEDLGFLSELLHGKEYRKHHSKAPWSLDGMSLPEPSKKLQDQYLDTCRGGTGILPPTANTYRLSTGVTARAVRGSQSARTAQDSSRMERETFVGGCFRDFRTSSVTAREHRQYSIRGKEETRQVQAAYQKNMETDSLPAASRSNQRLASSKKLKSLFKVRSGTREHQMQPDMQRMWSHVLPHIR